MDAGTLLDCAQFQLSPCRTRCELFVSGDGRTEKLASGFLKPFLTHLRVADEQASNGVQLIKLEIEKRKNAGTWFNKGTLERFVRFVSTPEVLELVNTFDAEMSQLEGARKIYSQGTGDRLSDREGDAETAAAATADVTKKELLRAIDVRLSALKQDLVTACTRTSAAGFTLDTVSELVLFADRFGAIRLHEACTKFISLCKQRPELLCHLQSLPPQWKGFDDANIRSSGSDMSIDELETNSSEQLKASTSGSLDSHKPSSGGLPQKSTAEAKASAQFLAEKALDKDKEELTPAVLSDEPAQPAGRGSRRLSVQDRINLFESKQKEQSVSTSVTSSISGAGGINKVISGKGEHRRLPSDASLEKSVLRRWSGASDMSIDLNNNSFTSERKECGNVAGTPTSTANSHVQSRCKAEESGLKDTATSWPQMNPQGNGTSISSSSLSQEQVKTFPKDRVLSDDVIMTEDITTSNKAQSEESLEEQGNFQTEFDSSLGGALQNTSVAPAAFQFISKRVSDSEEGSEAKDQAASLTHFKARSDKNVGSKDQEAMQIPQITVPATFVQSEYNDQAGESTLEVKRRATSGTKFRTFAEKPNADAKAKVSLDCQIQSKTSLGKVKGSTPKNALPSEAQWKTLPGNKVEARRKEVVASSQEPPRVSSVEMEEREFGSQLHGTSVASDQIKKVQGSREEITTNHGTRVPAISGKKAREGVHVLQPPSTPSVEQTQVARPSKGNQELNDELQIKANELERLFAAHKLRGHGDQMASSRRNKHVDDHALMSAEKVLPESLPDQLLEQKLSRDSLRNGVQFDANLLRMVGNLNFSQDMKQKLGDFSPSDDFRGILYEKYMQKRDEKLREDWGTKRAQKEAKLKAMHDSLVRSQAEMKAKFAGFADNQDSAFAQHRAERMRSFNVRSGRKNKGQKLEFLQVEGEDDLQGRENNLCGQDRSHSDTLSGNESSTSSKKLVSSKSLSSSTSRTSINPIPRPSAKATNSSSVHRRAQPENSHAQSVPNFSDFRKENTKPSARFSKVNSSGQPRAYARSKSTIEEANLVKDEKSHRSHSMRKNSTNSGELKNLTPLSSYAANQTPFRVSKDCMDQGVSKSLKSGESKSFLMKRNGIGPGAGVSVSKLKAFMNPETLKDGEESDELVDQQDDSPCVVKDEEEEFYRTSAEGNLQGTDFPVDLDSEDDDSESRNGDVLRSVSHVEDDFAAVPSKFGPSVGTMHESPGESPGSWNSNTHHSSSYAHEASDVDASMESPTGSPTSWNSFPLNQMMEADAARMRKKWGSAHIPVLVANASNQSCKDTTKGFKKFLKFGRKSRGVDYLVNDWVSASTASEGDDDTEDGREVGSRSSEDLRKSRMGYSIPTSYDFNEGDAFPEQVQSIRSSIPNATANFKLREDHLSGSSMKAPRSFLSLIIPKQRK